MHASVSAASLEKELEWNAFPYPYTLLLQLHRQHEDADVIMKKHIKLLHKYNESKDVTRLATLKETTVRQIHGDMDLARLRLTEASV
ncbi:hypothetical protein B0H14DRAFT_2834995 [Mycena olivaceomarginata]|nr:hypothetical protein B0H14DRAFT_2834995 [Mycena olivaceomarginata]